MAEGYETPWRRRYATSRASELHAALREDRLQLLGAADRLATRFVQDAVDEDEPQRRGAVDAVADALLLRAAELRAELIADIGGEIEAAARGEEVGRRARPAGELRLEVGEDLVVVAGRVGRDLCGLELGDRDAVDELADETARLLRVHGEPGLALQRHGDRIDVAGALAAAGPAAPGRRGQRDPEGERER